jgi:hypothetical protein
MIERLAQLTPDASRSARTIARCHDRLAGHRRRRERRDRADMAARHRGAKPRTLGAELVLVGGFCVAYLIAMAGDLFALAMRH